MTQLADILADEVGDGRWGEWLPEERELARQFQVSRSTLRGALGLLREQGVLQTQHGIGTRIAKPGRAEKPCESASIGMLLPRPLERYRFFATLAVDDLKTLLFARGQQLHLYEHPQVEVRRPTHLLEKLVQQQRHACWLLMACSLDTQRWFSRNGIPAVVAGTSDASVGLPCVCLDNQALGRHAALTLLQHGHRRIGALLTRSNLPLRKGIDEGMRTAPGATLSVYDVDESAAAVARAIDRLMGMTQRPTALFVAESSIYLTAFCRLTQHGRRVPEDISLLCRDDEPYLSSLLPAPARYSKSPHTFAKLLLGHISRLTAHEPITHPGTQVMPEFVPGESLRRMQVS